MVSLQRLFGACLLVVGRTSFVSAADRWLDVSQIIGKSEAATILGEPVRDPRPRSGDGADCYYSKSNYYRVGRGKSLSFGFNCRGPNAIDPQKELELLVAANGSMEKISGVGDTAQMLITAAALDWPRGC